MKRYVLTKDKIIRLSNEYDDYDAYIDKTSDNLIDLLEVGDCYETKDAEIYSIDNTYELTEQKTFYSYNVDLIKAIWKRNGDIMRRYER
jgi:hypothetical protein